MSLFFHFLLHQAAHRSVTEVDSAVKFVTCAKCQGEYVYKLTRAGKGSATLRTLLDEDGANERASQAAHASLRAQLEDSCDPVPCIYCGHYQDNMVAKLREEHLRWMQVAASGLIVIGFLIFLFALAVTYIHSGNMDVSVVPLSWGLAGGCLLAATLLIGARTLNLRKFDPHAVDAEKRKALGRYRAMSKADYLTMQEAEQRRDR